MAGVVQSSRSMTFLLWLHQLASSDLYLNSFHVFSSWVFYLSTVLPQAVSSILREWRYRVEILSTDMAWLDASQVFLQGISAVEKVTDSLALLCVTTICCSNNNYWVHNWLSKNVNFINYPEFLLGC